MAKEKIEKKLIIDEVDSNYDLELDKVISFIKREKAKIVCLQFPRGLANKSTKIAELIEKLTKAKCLIWIGPTFGACDLPVGLERLKPKVDVLIHFGHAKWKYKDDKAASSSEISIHKV